MNPKREKIQVMYHKHYQANSALALHHDKYA
jgi:hypothetical protein